MPATRRSHPRVSTALPQHRPTWLPLSCQALAPEDLQHVAVLGSGAFGRVTLVSYDSKYYALKCLSKGHVVQTGLQVGADTNAADATICMHALARSAA